MRTFIKIGPQDDLQLEPGWLIDGAYVESRSPAGDICFTVTTVPHDHGLSRHWPEACDHTLAARALA